MQTTADEITVPENDKPAWEWVNGRALQKMSPLTNHMFMQRAFLLALMAWAGKRGIVGQEWRFRLTPPGEPTRPLVPDVAYIPLERYHSSEDDQSPTVPPDIVVEILSPGDRRRDIDEKIRVYLAAGVKLVLYVDPRRRIVDAYGDNDYRATISAREVYTPPSFPDLTLDLPAMFAELNITKRNR